ncbi:MAG: hypothetical protein F6K03_15215 [Kamptonema sp. SIO4C4]|nr:hypothetical protein [Kamptonema sp. SIO4C4]
MVQKQHFQNIPEPLKVTIEEVAQQKYDELYETDQVTGLSLDDAIQNVVNTLLEIRNNFSDNRNLLEQELVYCCMALILAKSVQSTINQYNCGLHLFATILQTVQSRIKHHKKVLTNPDLNQPNLQNNFLTDISLVDPCQFMQQYQEEFRKLGIGNLQIIFDALAVYDDLIEISNYIQHDHELNDHDILTIQENLLNILGNCLEGDAIIPGSEGRRALFDWWLFEVVPASWQLNPNITPFLDSSYATKTSSNNNKNF